MKQGLIRKRLYISAITIFAMLMVPLVSNASDQDSIRKLSYVAYKLKSKGYATRSRVSGRYLSKGKSYLVRTTLLGGTNYIIYGAGDGGVKDLDIILYDENGYKIDKDSQMDALPVVRVRPSWTGTFYIKVTMYDGSGYSNIAISYRN
jgi:hypothetical protein